MQPRYETARAAGPFIPPIKDFHIQAPTTPYVAERHDASDDLARPVFGVFGIPLDVLDLSAATSKVRAAAAQKKPLLVSTPNTNFLIHSSRDVAFRDSLLQSDVSLPDGAPVVWLARLRGARLAQRLAGSDLFSALKRADAHPPLRVFLFGGMKGVAEAACRSLNAKSGGLVCVGAYDPGFGSIEAMSSSEIISHVNGSNADFLVVALGASKGQAWLLRNATALTVPVRSHLGATINFEAGTVNRAPRLFREIGLEWLWRIKEEPQLWSRYLRDATGLLGLAVKWLLPLLTYERILRGVDSTSVFEVGLDRADDKVVITLRGKATAENVAPAIKVFRRALSARLLIVVDLSATSYIDSRFIGVLLMLKKAATPSGGSRLVNVPARIRRLVQLNGFGFLLE